MIRLRKLEPTDLPFLYQWENDDTSWADSDTHNPLSQHDLRAYIDATTGDIYKDGQLRLIIEDGGTLGCADLFDFDPLNRKAAIGLYVTPEARGRGVGEGALEALERYAFGVLHLRMIYAIIATNNIACSRLFERRKYTPSSVLKGWTLASDAVIWQKMG